MKILSTALFFLFAPVLAYAIEVGSGEIYQQADGVDRDYGDLILHPGSVVAARSDGYATEFSGGYYEFDGASVNTDLRLGNSLGEYIQGTTFVDALYSYGGQGTAIADSEFNELNIYSRGDVQLSDVWSGATRISGDRAIIDQSEFSVLVIDSLEDVYLSQVEAENTQIWSYRNVDIVDSTLNFSLYARSEDNMYISHSEIEYMVIDSRRGVDLFRIDISFGAEIYTDVGSIFIDDVNSLDQFVVEAGSPQGYVYVANSNFGGLFSFFTSSPGSNVPNAKFENITAGDFVIGVTTEKLDVSNVSSDKLFVSHQGENVEATGLAANNLMLDTTGNINLSDSSSAKAAIFAQGDASLYQILSEETAVTANNVVIDGGIFSGDFSITAQENISIYGGDFSGTSISFEAESTDIFGGKFDEIFLDTSFLLAEGETRFHGTAWRLDGEEISFIDSIADLSGLAGELSGTLMDGSFFSAVIFDQWLENPNMRLTVVQAVPIPAAGWMFLASLSYLVFGRKVRKRAIKH